MGYRNSPQKPTLLMISTAHYSTLFNVWGYHQGLQLAKSAINGTRPGKRSQKTME